MQHLNPLAAAAAPCFHPTAPARAGWLLRLPVLRGLLPLLLLALAPTARAQTTFTYTAPGGAQTYTVPAGITAVRVVATGASGGIVVDGQYSTTGYGAGARVQATVAVTPGEVLTVMVGGQGANGNSSIVSVAGGYNGGGPGLGNGGGGGATDVRRASSVGSTGDYLTSRNALLVAGGGGGSSDQGAVGGNGGTPTGANGSPSDASAASYVGLGASQSAPGASGSNGIAGSNGTGGAGNTSGSGNYGSGGGGGYYGGGGSAFITGGGGGSSWVMPTGSTGISYGVATASGNGSVSITPVATFTYAAPGGPQTYTVPAGVTAVQITATGAGGGSYNTSVNSYGAQVQATVTVTPGEVLTVVVGGRGGDVTAGFGNATTAPASYNGGGSGNGGGAGGGASDVRRASSVGSTGDYLTTRNALLVAGGGGGSYAAPARGGNGGTPSGGTGQGANSAYASSGGGGASQTAPGSAGGNGGSPGSNGSGGGAAFGGGGGGYYGGGAGGTFGGGGGGSSWVLRTGSAGISYSVAAATSDGVVSITPVLLPDLVVSTAGQSVPAGLYNSITVLSGGTATLAGSTYVVNGATVQSGGTLDDGCTTLTGPGSFTLAAGGTLRICSPDGISATGSTGSIQVTGTRSFSPDASYVYTRSSTPATGPGLPATVRALAFATGGGGTLTLTNSVTATAAATLTNGGVLLTNANTLTLGPTATLSETATGYVTGTVQTIRPLSTAGATESFGGLGLTLTPSGTTLPGSTLVRRVTGTALTGAGSSGSVKRYFDIQPAVASGLNVALTLTVRDDERNNIRADRLSLFKSDDAGGTWQPQPAATVGTTAAAGNQPATYTASLAGVRDFSLWTLGDARNPLPVELTAFTATPAGPAAVRLAWATASEQNSQQFEVERSLDGMAFAAIGTVAAAGNSSSARRYELLDNRLPAGVPLLYYRLKQVDANGTFSYSPVRTVGLTGAAAGLALFPNPTHGAATLTGAQPGAVVTVVDALGRPVFTATADASGTAALVLPAGLLAGVYVVRAGAKAVRLTVE